jgi:septal ring factor EnvC (AmiA/AmiB activator)
VKSLWKSLTDKLTPALAWAIIGMLFTTFISVATTAYAFATRATIETTTVQQIEARTCELEKFAQSHEAEDKIRVERWTKSITSLETMMSQTRNDVAEIKGDVKELSKRVK